MDKQLRDGIDAELAKKGLSKTEADTADLLIGYQITIGQEKEFSSYSTGYGYGGGWGRGWYGRWHGKQHDDGPVHHDPHRRSRSGHVRLAPRRVWFGGE